MADQDADKHEKTEEATPFKLEEARRKGMVAKSQEISVVAGLIAVLLIATGIGNKISNDVLQLCHEMLLAASSAQHDMMPVLLLAGDWVIRVLLTLSPLVMLILAVGIATSIMQTGPVFSTHPLKPDWNRLNPVSGFKKVFSKRSLFELLKSVVKLAFLGAILFWVVSRDVNRLVALAFIEPDLYIVNLLDIGTSLLFKFVIALSIIAIIDNLFVRHTFLTQMKMTRRELKDEVKRRDGDPQVKSKRRQLERELRKRAESVASVKEADVVITNPTHYAVVLKYDRTSMRAPIVTGKGADKLALKIREEATRHHVPIVASPELTRFLFRKVAMESPVPDSTYLAVAKILHKAYQLRKDQKK